MKILVSNDDGVYAPGLISLVNCLEPFAEVRVVAPDRDRSAASNSLTLQSPLRVRQLENGFYSVEGTPTDCVHIALTGLLNESFDLVIAGINAGANLGDDVLYSGTVAAAMEGRFLGVPAIAISMIDRKMTHIKTAEKITRRLIQGFIENSLPRDTLLNVNIPDVPFDELKGQQVTRLGTRHKSEPTLPDTDPRGETIYWIGPPGKAQDIGEDTDFYVTEQNYVSITPLQLDLTNYDRMNAITDWLENTTV